MSKKSLGTITHAAFGIAEGRLGLHIQFSFGGFCLGRFYGADVMEEIRDVLVAFGHSDVRDLVGVPVEVETEKGTLVDWRVLTEAI